MATFKEFHENLRAGLQATCLALDAAGQDLHSIGFENFIRATRK